MITSCEFFAGWFSGVCGLIIGYPADTVKVRQQSFKSQTATKIIVSTYRHEGVRGFYKGWEFPVLAAGAYNSIFFGVYGNSLRILTLNTDLKKERRLCCEPGTPEENWHSHVFVAGCLGGLATLSIGCPIELVKTQLQVQTGHAQNGGMTNHICHKGPWTCLKNIYRIGGIRMCYRGLISMALRDIPAFGMYTLAYEHIVCLLQGKIETVNDIHSFNEIVAGGLAGIASWMFVMPFDVIKSRLQSDNILNPKFKGMMDCFRQSYQQEGWGIFTRGFWVTSLRAFPTNAVTFVSYEIFLDFCEKFR